MAVKKKTYKIKDKIIIIGNTTGHGIPLNTTCTLGRITGTNYYTVEYPGVYLRITDFIEAIYSLEYIKSNIKELEIELEEAKAKLNFMKANKLSEFDSDQFKVYEVLKTLDSKSSLLEKSTIIANLIKS